MGWAFYIEVFHYICIVRLLRGNKDKHKRLRQSSFLLPKFSKQISAYLTYKTQVLYQCLQHKKSYYSLNKK